MPHNLKKHEAAKLSNNKKKAKAKSKSKMMGKENVGRRTKKEPSKTGNRKKGNY